ncbi:MAG: aspartate-semialdehyde dehydrogenase, partial [bacterium]
MYNVAVAGATGAVGRQMLEILAERDFPIDNLVALASPRSRGKKLPYRERELEVEVLAERSFEDIDLALFSAGSGVVAGEAPRILDE